MSLAGSEMWQQLHTLPCGRPRLRKWLGEY